MFRLLAYLAELSDKQAIPTGSIATDCHPSSIMTNLGETPPFSKLEKIYIGILVLVKHTDIVLRIDILENV
jgi:hypothetical protein